VVEHLGECGWRIQRHITEHAGQATEFARQAALDGRDLVRIDFGAGSMMPANAPTWSRVVGDHSVLLSTPKIEVLEACWPEGIVESHYEANGDLVFTSYLITEGLMGD
jgi:hypothetical protein